MPNNYLYYDLPAERIAQRPVNASGLERSAAKLLRVKKSPAGLELLDQHFSDLPQILNPGDLLVMNNSRVTACRFFAKREGGDEVEIFLLRKSQGGCAGFPCEIWSALARPLKKLTQGETLCLSSSLRAEVLGKDSGEASLKIYAAEDAPRETLEQLIQNEGLMPIPPYVREGRADRLDRETYQTVYADIPGSVAAPTAGFHFTPELLEELRRKGVQTAFVTLHVGRASFRLIREGELNGFEMPGEQFLIPESTVKAINAARAHGGRVISVGTTTTRALETFFGMEKPRSDTFFESELFIRPGYRFRAVDLLITNFHQPGSTHLLMVAAFIGEEELAAVYLHALRSDYRFLSYGDSMVLEQG